MKKILIIVLAAVVGAGIVFVAVKRPWEQKDSLVISNELPSNKSALLADPLLGRIGADVLFHIRLNAANLKPVKDLIERTYARLLTTGAARKWDLPERSPFSLERLTSIWQELKSMPGLEEVTETASQTGSEIGQLDFTVFGFKAPIEDRIPKMLLQASFSDTSVGDRIGKLIDEKLMQNESVFENGKIRIEKTTDGNVSYKVSARGEENHFVNGQGVLQLAPGIARIFVGSVDEKDFFPVDETSRLVSSGRSAPLEFSFDDENAIYIIFDGKRISEILSELKIEEETGAKFEELMNAVFKTNLQELGMMAMGQTFKGHVSSRQCITVASGGALHKTYSKMAGAATVHDSSFSNLISANTLFALRASGGTASGFFEMMASQYQALGKFGASTDHGDEKEKRVQEMMSKISKPFSVAGAYLESNAVDEVGLRIEYISNTPVPEFSLYISSASADARRLNQALKDMINSLAAELLADQKPLATDAKLDSGEEVVEIKPTEAFTIRFAPVNAHAIRATLHGPLLGVAPVSGTAGSYFDKLPGVSHLLDGRPEGWDVYYMINTGAIFEMSKQYLPLLLAQQTVEPEKQLSMQDVEEIASIFSGHLMVGQKTRLVNPDTFCFDSALGVVD